MKLAQHTNTHISSNIVEQDQFGMDQKDMPHITNILRNQMYSDKLMAILREYSTNAYDAHADRNCQNIPIEVTFPTTTVQTLKIRDFGYGLTEEDVMKTYIKYGSSTKRNSNAFTGCLGIGCKSGFSYSTQFTITSYKHGRKSSYLAKINEHNVGTISKTINSVPSDESSGVEISIPIKSSDHSDLISKGKKFFSYWSVTPKTNITIDKIVRLITKDKYDLIQRDDSYSSSYSYNSNKQSHVFMGNIAYPINTSILNAESSAVTAVLSCSSILLKLPLGSVDIAASREALEYTDKTKNMLIATAVNIAKDMSSEINDKINKLKSPIKASILAQNMLTELTYDIRQIVQANLNFKGKRLTTTLSFGKPIVRHSKFHRWRAKEYINKRETDITSTSIKADMHICSWNDNIIPEANATRRIRTLQVEHGDKNDAVYLVVPADELSQCTPQLTEEDIIDLSTIKPLPANRAIKVNKDGTKVIKKAKVTVCELKPSHMKSARIKENVEAKPEVDGKYYYIPLDRFDWLGTNYDHDSLQMLESIKESINHLNYIIDGVSFKPTIYGVKKHYLKKLDNNWIDVKKYLASLWKKAVKAHPKLTELGVMYHSDTSYSFPDGHSMSSALSKCNNKNIAMLSKLNQYNSQFHKLEYKANNPDMHEVRAIESISAVAQVLIALDLVKETDKRAKLEEKCIKRYPLLPYLTSGYTNSGDLTTAINHYIK